jgi:hypothetical protein
MKKASLPTVITVVPESTNLWSKFQFAHDCGVDASISMNKPESLFYGFQG